MARPLIAGRGHRDLSLYRNFILNDHRWSSNTSKSAHKQKRTFASSRASVESSQFNVSTNMVPDLAGFPLSL